MAAIALVFWAFCLFQLSALAQDADAPWSWLMADSIHASLVCPGRCLAVNDSSNLGDYEDKEVGFFACKSGITSGSDESNNNQQWIYDDRGSSTTIRINASYADPPVMLCLQPRRTPKSSHVSLTVAKCSNKSSNQRWMVANSSVASLAFDPPLYLAMAYKLSSDATWRRAYLVPGNDPGLLNKSLTKVLSMVESTKDHTAFPYLNISNLTSDSGNFIQNGGFEQSSFEFPYNVTEFDVDQNELFGICHWEVPQTGVQLLDATASMPPAEGNRSLFLKAGIIQQRARTRPGAFYVLEFKIAVAKPQGSAAGSSSDGRCNGTETISVNAFPSTNVKVNLNCRSQVWEPKHLAFQAVGDVLLLVFMGCSTCGCHLDEVNLMQVSNPTPLPPPPPFTRPRAPSPEIAPQKPKPAAPPRDNMPHPQGPIVPSPKSNGLCYGLVAGLLVASSLLSFLLGGGCFAIACLKKEPKAFAEEDLVRPHEWSIQTTSPPRSDVPAGSQQLGSEAPSAPQPPQPHAHSSPLSSSVEIRSVPSVSLAS